MTDSIDVLLVDEDEEVLDLTKTFLENDSERITADTETDPSLAVDRTVEEGFDCVVSDYRMPEMDGIELCGAIHDEAAVPFFLFTAASEGEVGDSREDVTGYVQKGVGTAHYEELAERIEAAFA